MEDGDYIVLNKENGDIHKFKIKNEYIVEHPEEMSWFENERVEYLFNYFVDFPKHKNIKSVFSIKKC